ncbi:MAG: hypothetical protein MUD01_28365 [Chloroflexaceae bacterium]|nr:hypothetical protein [Chloroflexaceae bacterium]
MTHYAVRIIPLLLAFVLVACGPVDPGQDPVGGGDSPTLAAEGFFQEMNKALQSPDLSNLDGRGRLAQRMAAYFPPRERGQARDTIQRTLATFYGRQARQDNRRMVFEIIYSNVALVERNGDRALVRLEEGKVRLRIYGPGANGSEALLSEQVRPLSEVLGVQSDTFPTVFVNGRWFLTDG